MEVVYERCCGLDVHKRTVVATPRHMMCDAGVYLGWQQNRQVRGQFRR